MQTLVYPLAGRPITLYVRQNTRKNIILRPHGADSLQLGIPPWLRRAELLNWLADNEALLHRFLSEPPCADPAQKQPESIWLHGRRRILAAHTAPTVLLSDPDTLHLPEADWPTRQAVLRRFLFQAASESLLPRLHGFARQTGYQPAAAALTHARTFWGICRAKTGIRPNWRLIGAPPFVQDYVCLHELCHLPHPDHSPRFWAEVARHTPYTDEAKRWLKQHGRELFVCG